jgi:hypothetical protein
LISAKRRSSSLPCSNSTSSWSSSTRSTDIRRISSSPRPRPTFHCSSWRSSLTSQAPVRQLQSRKTPDTPGREKNCPSYTRP